MSDAGAPLVLSRSEGRPVVLLGDGEQIADMAALLQRAPGLVSPARATELARTVNHFVHGDEFEVITDPADFARQYRRQLESEDPAAPWDQLTVRLGDFGMADLAAITPPAFDRGRLVYWAVDVLTGLPYRAETTDPARAPDYSPIRMHPLPRPPAGAAEAEDQPRPLQPPEREERPTPTRGR